MDKNIRNLKYIFIFFWLRNQFQNKNIIINNYLIYLYFLNKFILIYLNING